MSAVGGPSQEVARGVIRFEPDLRPVEDAKPVVEKMVDDLATMVRERLGGAFREVFDQADQRLQRLREGMEGMRLPDGQPQGGGASAPRTPPEEDQSLIKLTQIETVVQEVRDGVAQIVTNTQRED